MYTKIIFQQFMESKRAFYTIKTNYKHFAITNFGKRLTFEKYKYTQINKYETMTTNFVDTSLMAKV